MNCLLHNTKRYSFKPKVMCQLFDAFVGSIHSYSCEIGSVCMCVRVCVCGRGVGEERGECKEIEEFILNFVSIY